MKSPLTLLAIGLFIMAAGCARDQGVNGSRSGSTGEGGLSGRIWNVSDVQTIPDSPMQALVLAFRAEHYEQLRSEFVESPAGLSLSEEAFGRYGAAETLSDTAGYYALKLMPGSYWVCLDSYAAGRAAKFPLSIIGCVPVTVPESGSIQKNLSVSEGRLGTGR